MTLPRRIVRKYAQGWGIQHEGQRFYLDARAVESKRGWVWVHDAPGSIRGAVPAVILYDGPDTNARIVGRAEPETRWLSADPTYKKA